MASPSVYVLVQAICTTHLHFTKPKRVHHHAPLPPDPSPATSQLPTPESCHKTILSMDLPFNFYASETCVYVFFFGWSDFTVTLHIETPVLILLTHTEHSPRDEVLPRSNTPPTFALLAFGRLGI
jgi:hypothetical protein